MVRAKAKPSTKAKSKRQSKAAELPAPNGVVYVDVRVPLLMSAARPAFPPHVESRMMPGDQANAFTKLHHGLLMVNARLASGQPVRHLADVPRWLVEQIAAKLS